MKRHEVTLVERVVIISIIGVLFLLVIPAVITITRNRYKPIPPLPIVGTKVGDHYICKVVALKEWLDPSKRYNTQTQGNFIYRVLVLKSNIDEVPATDVELVGSDNIDVFANTERYGKDNTEIVQANLQVGRWYVFTIEENGEPLKNIVAVRLIPHQLSN